MSTAVEEPAWQALYRRNRDRLLPVRVRAISGIALLLISLASVIDGLTGAGLAALAVPTRLLLFGASAVGLALSMPGRAPRVYTAAAVGVFAACALHVEAMIVLYGDVSGSFPFLLLLAPLAALLLPSTGVEVGVLSVAVVGMHTAGLFSGRVDGDARVLALEMMALVAGCAIATRMALAIDRARRRDAQQQAAIELERARADSLLQNILPHSIAEQLKAESKPIADGFSDVTILFGDIVGFTPLASALDPERLVAELNALFSVFDDEAGRRGLEKIKTIGDCYMVAAGLPSPRADHADAIVDFALWLRDTVASWPEVEGHALQLRIGVNTGPVVAGVIGRSKFIYDLWGDAVNVAARMESTGEPGMVQITEATRQALTSRRVALEARHDVMVKGKGQMRTWVVRPLTDEGSASAPERA